MRKLNSELHWLTGLGAIINAYVWNGDTLLDTGGPLVAHAFFREMRKNGFDPKGVRHVLLSHCHIDHAGGLAHMHDEINVYGEANDLNVLLGKLEPPRYHPKYGFLVEAVEKLIPSFQFGAHHKANPVADKGLAQGWRAIHVPGHTPGSVCWYQPETRTLFTGDVLVNHFHFLTGPAPLFTENYTQAIQSLGQLKELEVETVVFGHGQPLVKGAEKTLHGLVDRLTEQLAKHGEPAWFKAR